MIHRNKAEKWGIEECVFLGDNEETKPCRCPVCGGRGIVPNGFYTIYADTTNSSTAEPCRTCNGRGVIWK